MARGRGEGSVYQRADGLWAAASSAGFDGNGKRVRLTAYGQTKRAALTALEELKRRSQLGVSNPGVMTVGELLDSWLVDMQPQWQPGTYRSHEQHIRNHLRAPLGGVRLNRLNATHVRGAMRSLEETGLSAALRRHIGVTLRAALQYAVRLRLVAENPATLVPLPAKPNHRSEGITHEQLAVFLAAAEGDRLQALYLLAIDSGLRQGELLALVWRDLDLDRVTVRVTKSLEELGGQLWVKSPKTKGSIRTIELSQLTITALSSHRVAMLAEGHCTPDSPIFCGPRRGQYLRKTDLLRQSFVKILKRSGLKFRFHDFRHASATLLLSSGIDLKTVQGRLGHSTASITMDVYAHAVDRGQKVAAATMQTILARQA